MATARRRISRLMPDVSCPGRRYTRDVEPANSEAPYELRPSDTPPPTAACPSPRATADPRRAATHPGRPRPRDRTAQEIVSVTGGAASAGRTATTAPCRARARRAAPSTPAPGATSASSSPPIRASVSDARTEVRADAAIAQSTSSPTVWPKVSLIVLKRSTSTRRTENGRPAATQSSNARSKARRFGRPVSGSSCAIRRWRSSAATRYAMR